MAMINGEWVPDSASGMRKFLWATQGADQVRKDKLIRDSLISWLNPQGAATPTTPGATPGQSLIPRPSFFNTDWQNPFTPEQQGVMKQKRLTDVEGTLRTANSNMDADLARRGLRGPGVTSSFDVGNSFRKENMARVLQGQVDSDVLGKTLERGDTLRGEQMKQYLGIIQMLLGGKFDIQAYLQQLSQQEAQQKAANAAMWGSLFAGAGTAAGAA